MLKGIPAAISPELMFVLMKMGHGDEIVLADGNFPADSHAQRIVRADGLSVPEVLEAILTLFPLDSFVDAPAWVMKPVDANSPNRSSVSRSTSVPNRPMRSWPPAKPPCTPT